MVTVGEQSRPLADVATIHRFLFPQAGRSVQSFHAAFDLADLAGHGSVVFITLTMRSPTKTIQALYFMTLAVSRQGQMLNWRK
jgi:hypothetical protein